MEFITQLLRWNEFSEIIFKKNLYSMPENCALRKQRSIYPFKNAFFFFTGEENTDQPDISTQGGIASRG